MSGHSLGLPLPVLPVDTSGITGRRWRMAIRVKSFADRTLYRVPSIRPFIGGSSPEVGRKWKPEAHPPTANSIVALPLCIGCGSSPLPIAMAEEPFDPNFDLSRDRSGSFRISLGFLPDSFFKDFLRLWRIMLDFEGSFWVFSGSFDTCKDFLDS